MTTITDNKINEEIDNELKISNSQVHWGSLIFKLIIITIVVIVIISGFTFIITLLLSLIYMIDDSKIPVNVDKILTISAIIFLPIGICVKIIACIIDISGDVSSLPILSEPTNV